MLAASRLRVLARHRKIRCTAIFSRTSGKPARFTRHRGARSFSYVLLGLSALIPGCAKKAPPSQPPPPKEPASEVASEPKPQWDPAERYRFAGSITELGDMLKAVGDASRWFSEDPLDPAAQIQAILLGTGFAPAFWGSLDLAGVHAVEVLYPHDHEYVAEHAEFAASIAVTDARKFIESMPQSMRPQPLGGGLWEMIFEQDEGSLEPQRLLVREQARAVEVGQDADDLDRAGTLVQGVSEGRRIQVQLNNIPPDRIDPTSLFDLPPDSAVGQRLGKVIRNVQSVGAEFDVGTDRDLQLFVTAQGPFDTLGLDPVGPPQTEASVVEGRLPPGPVLALTFSWGDPALVHKMLDRDLGIDDIPEPFGTPAKQGRTHVQTLLDQAVGTVVAAVYLNSKEEGTLVLASQVRDTDAAREAVRGLHATLAAAADAHRKLTGGAKDSEIVVKWKPSSIKVAGSKADLFSITVPPNLREDTRMMGALLERNQLDIVSWVQDGTAVMAMGKGAKGLVADVARGPKGRSQSLGTDTGLRLARTSVGGCQICIGVTDLAGAFRLRWILKSQDPEADEATKQAARKAIATLRSLEIPGGGGLGIKVEPDRTDLAWIVAKETLFANPEVVAKVRSIQMPKRPDEPPAD